ICGGFMHSPNSPRIRCAYAKVLHFGISGCLALSALLFLSALTGTTAQAQAVYGSIIGTVTDPSGAVVPNASVTVSNVAKGTSVTVTTNSSGQYTVQHLISDVYQVSAEATGFTKTTQNGVQVYVDTAPRVDLKLAAEG